MSILKYPIVRKFIETFSPLLSFINYILPKKKNRIFFFDSKEVFLNNYALFKYLIAEHYNEKYEIHFYMPSLVLKNEISSLKNTYFIGSLLKAYFILVTSKFVFVDASSLRVRPSKKQIIHNLWHGTPLKCIGFMSASAEKDKLPANYMNSFSYCSISSKNFCDIFVKSFNGKPDQFVVLGQPRIDLLLSKINVLDKIGINQEKYKRIYMWMTTYRFSYDGRLNHSEDRNWSQTNLPLIIDLDKIIKLNEVLTEENEYMIIKIHQGSVFERNIIKPFSNIKILQDCDFISKVQLYQIVKDCDVLVTDYSSIYFDYLFLDRPIMFIIDDIDSYKKNPGFVFEKPLAYMPGLKIKSFDELVGCIVQKSYNDKRYIAERKKVHNFVNFYQDNKNCERILDFCEIHK